MFEEEKFKKVPVADIIEYFLPIFKKVGKENRLNLVDISYDRLLGFDTNKIEVAFILTKEGKKNIVREFKRKLRNE